MAEIGWRSTSLNLAARTCSRSLDYLEEGRPYDRAVFAVGSAAHACLEDVGVASRTAGRTLFTEEAEPIMRATCERLIREGRDFEGEREPPLPPDAVWRGRDLALSYLWEESMPHHGHYEEGLAVNREWMACPYDPGAWLRAKIDCWFTALPGLLDDDYDSSGPTLVVRDYKSSWSAGEEELRSTQRKIQAVLAWDRWGEGHESLRVEVVNFRLRRVFNLSVYPQTPEGTTVLARWRRDIESEITQREAQRGADGKRPASPGAQCYGCPYVMGCAPALGYLARAYGSHDARDLARSYAVAAAVVDALKAPLRAATEHAPIPVHGGVIGTIAKPRRTLLPHAAAKLVEVIRRHVPGGSTEDLWAKMPGLLRALKLGVANAESLLTFFYQKDPESIAKRTKILAGIIGEKPAQLFGLHKDVEYEDTREEG